VLVEDRTHELATSYKAALDNGSKWRGAIRRSIKQRPEIGRLLDQTA
jgi:hypothetical protein